MSLKSTLRLPSSKFPPRPTPESLLRYAKQCSNDLYAWQRKARPPNSTFRLHDGPPYANGDLHVGHALNKITKDIICRSHLARGKRIDFVPGWDCHGLPIEQKVYEKNGWERASIDPVKVRGAARGFAAKTVEKQMKGFQSWGIAADWDNRWTTMDKEFEIKQLQALKAMVEMGHIVRRHKPVYWSPSSQTALAEAEIEREEHTSTAAVVKFRIPAMIGGSTEAVHAVIWTTTPWTLPANQAIAINQNMKYVLVRSETHGLLIVAQSRVEYLAEKLKEEVEVVKPLLTDTILDCSYSGLSEFGEDAFNKPIVHADFVTEEDGTGLVHCAPGHGNEDHDALQSYIQSGQVKVKAPVNDKGEFTEAASPSDPSLLAGKYVFKEGNKAVLALLKKNNALITSYNFRHKYPVDWRTKQPIMIRATAQWFADISAIKRDVIESLDSVKFRPESGKSRLKSFIENRSEWCISRQRAWGVPIPVLYHKHTNEAVMTGESIAHIIKVIEERGINSWWSDAPHDPAWVAPGLTSEDYVRGRDTLDVWFDSGTSWTFMVDALSDHYQRDALADVYFEGSDQHRGWFQSSILTNIAYQKATTSEAPAYAPFRHLITHGFTLDGTGKKMSKSVGNVVNPDQIIAGLAPQAAPKKGRVLHPYGPDALRLWAAMSDYTSDVVISEKVVTAVHTLLGKFRVTMKVILGMLGDFDPTNLVTYSDMHGKGLEVHRIALLQVHDAVSKVQQCMTDYEFHKAVQTVNDWVNRDISAFYLEAVKDSVYCDTPLSERRKISETVLYHIFTQFQHLLGAITPLLVEEAYEYTPEKIREHAGHPLQRVWQHPPSEWKDAVLASSVDNIMAVNSAVKAAQEKAREAKKLGQSLACEVEIRHKSGKPANITDYQPSFWENLLVVSKVHLTPVEESGKEWIHTQSLKLGDASYEVLVYPPTQEKCARCWAYTAPQPQAGDVALCSRCAEVPAVADIVMKKSD